MLNLLNNKLDRLLEEIDKKADQAEVLKLRDRMHKVEGTQAVLMNFVETMKEQREDLHAIDGRVTRIEASTMSEAAVETALANQRKEQRTLLFQLGGLLGIPIIGNIVINVIQGAP